MAFLREYIHLCDRCHKSPAIFELFTRRNEVYGRYCRRCSGPMLRQVKTDEGRYFAKSRTP